jgi:hypothetical protein
VESLEKTINLQKLTDKHYHTMLYRVHCCIEYTRHVYLLFKYNVEGTKSKTIKLVLDISSLSTQH